MPHAEGARLPSVDDVPLLLRGLQLLLVDAGAIVLLGDIASWTAQELHEAEVWALQQIQADRTAKPGTAVSLAWPDHVGLAALTAVRRRRGHRPAGMTRRKSRRR